MRENELTSQPSAASTPANAINGEAKTPLKVVDSSESRIDGGVIHMKVTDKEVLFQGNYLRLVRKDIEASIISRKWTWETVERVNVYGRGAVVIAAVTGGKESIPERNWRAPLESYIIQFPAGVMDVEKEKAKKTRQGESSWRRRGTGLKSLSLSSRCH